MRAQYLFDLAHWCGIRPWETWDLTLAEFQNLADACDKWPEIEMRMRR